MTYPIPRGFLAVVLRTLPSSSTLTPRARTIYTAERVRRKDRGELGHAER